MPSLRTAIEMGVGVIVLAILIVGQLLRSIQGLAPAIASNLNRSVD